MAPPAADTVEGAVVAGVRMTVPCLFSSMCLSSVVLPDPDKTNTNSRTDHAEPQQPVCPSKAYATLTQQHSQGVGLTSRLSPTPSRPGLTF